MDKEKKSLIIEMIVFCMIIVSIAAFSYLYTSHKLGNDLKNEEEEGKSMDVISVNSKNFSEEVLNNKGKVLVDFYADWCGPCKMMSPVIDQISEEVPDVKVCKLNVDNAQDIASEYDVMSIPTIMIFENGEVKQKFIGVTSKDEIINALK